MEDKYEDEEFSDEDYDYDPEIDEDPISYYSRLFNDYDYKDQEKTAAFMEKYLDEGERILWSQSTYPKANGKEKHMGCSTAFAAMLIVEPLLLIFFIPRISAAIIVSGIILLLIIKKKKRRYAVTDRRIIMREGLKLTSIPLEEIVDDDFVKIVKVLPCDISERGIGSVCITKKLVVRKNGVKIPKFAYIRGIRNPGYASYIIRQEVKAVKGLDYC